jgi:hypothetical protein
LPSHNGQNSEHQSKFGAGILGNADIICVPSLSGTMTGVGGCLRQNPLLGSNQQHLMHAFGVDSVIN